MLPAGAVPAIPKLSWTCRVQFFRFATLVSPLSFWLGRQNSDAEFSANRDPHLARRGLDREPPVAIASARGCSRVSTSDQQSLPMQSRAMRGYAALGKSPLRPPLHAAPPDHHHRLLEARFFIRIVSMSLTNFSRGVSKIQCSPFSTNSNTSKLRNWRDRAISAYLSLSGRENIR